MDIKVKSSVITGILLIAAIVVSAFLSADVVSAATPAPVTWDFYVVAGVNTSSPGLPAPATPSNPGFSFAGVGGGGYGTVSAAGYDYGKIAEEDMCYQLDMCFIFLGPPNSEDWAKVNITNLLGYDIILTDLTAELTSSTMSLDYLHPYAGMQGNHSLVHFESYDPGLDEVDYVNDLVYPKYDRLYGALKDDSYSILTGPDSSHIGYQDGPASLVEPDVNGDAVTTGHVAPIPLANGSTLTEYMGIRITGNATSGTPIYGTITLTLEYKIAMPPDLEVVAITQSFPASYPDWPGPQINVTIRNLGASSLDLNFSLQCGNYTKTAQYHRLWLEIENQSLTLPAGTNTTITLTINPSAIPANHSNPLRAVVTSNFNASAIYFDKLVSCTLHLKMPGDVDGDQDVDSTDVFSHVALAYGKSPPNPLYKLQCDFDYDNDVDSTDVFSYLALNYGKSYG